MRLSGNYTMTNNNRINSNPSFTAIYTNSKAVDLIDTYITHGAQGLSNGIKGSVNKLNALTKKLNTDVVIERGADEFTARVVEVTDHLDMDTYRVVNYLTEEERLPKALNSAVKKLTSRLTSLEKAKQPRRRPFPGRQTLDIKG